MTVLNNNSWPLGPHPCPMCGKLTIFRLCDPCVGVELRLSQTSDKVDRGALGGPADGDEFARTLEAVRAAPEVTPAVRYWSGMCLWCSKEIREQSGEDVTHRPPLHLIRTCYRHRKALLGLSAWLRHEKFGDAADGNGQGWNHAS